MDFGTKVVLFLVSVIGLGTALVVFRTARLKHDKEAFGGGAIKQPLGPFDDMFKTIAAFGAVLVPMLMLFGTVALFVAGVKLLIWIPSADAPEQKLVAAPIDRSKLNPKEVRLFDLAMTGASMGRGNDRNDALRHVTNLAVGEKVYSMALLAASRMALGNDRQHALTFVALSAVRDNDPVTANSAVQTMALGNDRNEAARKVMSILEAQKAK